MSETPPPQTAELEVDASTSETNCDKPLAKPLESTKMSGIRPPSSVAAKSRIGRPCMHSGLKAPIPSLQQSKFLIVLIL